MGADTAKKAVAFFVAKDTTFKIGAVVLALPIDGAMQVRIAGRQKHRRHIICRLVKGMSSRFLTVFTASLLALSIGFAFGHLTGKDSYAEKASHEPYERLDTFAQVLNVIESNYVDTVDRTAMIDGAIHGMVRALDPHSNFLSAAERKDFEQRTQSQFVGIGMEVGMKGDELRIITTFYGGPAQRAGLQSGDVILGIDGKDVSTMSLDELFNALRGEVGSTVKLSVKHPDKLSIQTYVVERAVVQLDMVRSMLLDGDYGYVAIKTFGTDTAKKVKAEIDKLNGYVPRGVKGLILDLRKNPGGFLNEGVAVANLFIPSGNIVSTRGRDGVSIQSYDASRLNYVYDMPMAVLIDEGSASASEIVAGALQDHHRAVIVGQTSFGKASIQNMFKLKDGSTVKLTIGRYYTPSGKCIQAQGIVPDVEVEDLVLQMRPRSTLREKDLEHAITADGKARIRQENEGHAPGSAMTADGTRGETAETQQVEHVTGEPLPSINDLQLFTALQQLRAREFFMNEQ